LCRSRCEDSQTEFLNRCFYVAGAYDAPEGYVNLNDKCREQEALTLKVGGCASARVHSKLSAAA